MELWFRAIRPRPMSLMALLCFTLSLTSLMVQSSTANDDDRPSVTEVLEDYSFPPGLLPKGVVGYDLDKSTGKFAAYLNGTCSFSLEDSYDLKYKSAIKGYISKGRLRNLEGVSVKILLFWVNIVEVIRRGDDLELSVGIASASFPVDNFVERPQCGCGLNCNHVQLNFKDINGSLSQLPVKLSGSDSREVRQIEIIVNHILTSSFDHGVSTCFRRRRRRRSTGCCNMIE